MDIATRLANLEQQVQQLVTKRVGKQGILPSTINQQSIASGYALLMIDLAANRPSYGTPSCYFFFARDTGVLSVWTNSAWKSVTLD